MVRRILLRGSFPRCELSDRPLGVTHHPHWFHPTAPFFDLPQLPSPHVLPLRLTAGGCPMLHCGAHMGVAAPVKQAAVNTPCTVQPPSLPSHPLPRLTRAHGRRARRTTVARRRRRPHPTANAAVRSHSPPLMAIEHLTHRLPTQAARASRRGTPCRCGRLRDASASAHGGAAAATRRRADGPPPFQSQRPAGGQRVAPPCIFPASPSPAWPSRWGTVLAEVVAPGMGTTG